MCINSRYIMHVLVNMQIICIKFLIMKIYAQKDAVHTQVSILAHLMQQHFNVFYAFLKIVFFLCLAVNAKLAYSKLYFVYAVVRYKK